MKTEICKCEFPRDKRYGKSLKPGMLIGLSTTGKAKPCTAGMSPIGFFVKVTTDKIIVSNGGVFVV